MKTFKRFSAILLTVLLMVSMMVIPASADDTTYTITINGNDADHEYEAYRIFAGSLYTTGGGDTGIPETVVLSNIVWGDGVTSTGQSHFGDAKVKASSLGTPAGALAFAKELVSSGYLGTAAGTSSYAGGKYTISVTGAGYYLIKDVSGSLGENEYHAYTDYILKVVKNVSVDPKAANASLTLQVANTENGSYAEAVNTAIGREVFVEMNGSMTPMISTYGTYKMVFEATLPTSMDYAGDGLVKVMVTNDLDAESHDATLGTDYSVNYDAGTRKLTVTVENAASTITRLTENAPLVDDNVVVHFGVRLNTSAVIGKVGNSIKGQMKFSNDPNNNTLGTTPEQSAEIYTHTLQVDKVDSNSAATKLANAQFKLWRYEGSGSSAVRYAKADDLGGGKYKITTSTADEADATIFVTNGTGQIIIEGIADGTYHMTETAPPAGYNSLEGSFGFNSTAALSPLDGTVTGFTANKAGSMAGISVSADSENCTVLVVVQNTAGSQLPETGGIGTTIFYGIGGVLVIAALALLTVRKRSTAK